MPNQLKKGIHQQPSAYSERAQNPDMGSVTTSFFVAMDELLKSNVEGFETAAELLYFTSVEERVTSGNMAGDFQASATLKHSLLELHIQTSSCMPVLRQTLRNNSNVASIKITRVGHIGEGSEDTEMYSTEFTDCKLETMEEFPDTLIIKARVSTRSDTAAETDHTGAQAVTSGSTASGWDYRTNKPMA